MALKDKKSAHISKELQAFLDELEKHKKEMEKQGIIELDYEQNMTMKAKIEHPEWFSTARKYFF